MSEIDKFFQKFIGQSQGQGRFLRLSVEDNLVGGTFIGRKGNQDYLKVKIDGLQLTGGGGVQSVTGLNTNNSDPQNPIVQISIGSGLSGNGTPSSPLTATGGGGTVTGATISGALSVSGSVTLAFVWTGTTGQYVRGDGSLATFPTIPSVGTWGALNYPNWTTGTPFVKMTAVGTFALDTNTYLTANQTITLSGEATGSGTTSIGVTLTNSAVIGKVLTGYVSGAGTVAATDSILQAIQKLNGNIAAKTNTLTIFAANGTWGGTLLNSTTYYMPIQGGIGTPLIIATTFLTTFTFAIEITGLMIQHLNNGGAASTAENFIFGIYNATDIVFYPFLNIQTNQTNGVSKNFQTFALSQAIPANKALCIYCTTPAWVTKPTQLVLRTTLLFDKT
jgi:hypothetical protein